MSVASGGPALARDDAYTDLVRRGIAAARQGDRAGARRLFEEAVGHPGHDEIAWLWLASLAESRDESAAHLERVLAMNPADSRARSWLAQIRAERPRPRRGWRCPLCGGEALVEVVKCPRCRAVVGLADLDLLLGNPDADTPAIEAAVRRLEATSGGQVTFEVHFALGLAYLNLKRLYEGVTRLRVAAQLRPDDERLRRQVGDLARRQEESAAAARLQQAGKAARERRLVLVVDDSPTVQKLVGIALDRQGHQVVVAGNALQALARLDEERPDLVLLDITMPHMDGFQLLKLIRGNPATRDLPVVMLSGKDGLLDKVRGRLAGSTDYITKPFDPATVVRAVEKHCRRRVEAG